MTEGDDTMGDPEPAEDGWYRRNFHGSLVECVKDVDSLNPEGRDVSYESPPEYDSRSEFLQVKAHIRPSHL